MSARCFLQRREIQAARKQRLQVIGKLPAGTSVWDGRVSQQTDGPQTASAQTAPIRRGMPPAAGLPQATARLIIGPSPRKGQP